LFAKKLETGFEIEFETGFEIEFEIEFVPAKLKQQTSAKK